MDQEEESEVRLAPRPYTESRTDISPKSKVRQWISAIIFGLAYFVIGTGLGWPSPVLYKHRRELHLTRTDETLIVALFYAANVISPIPSGMLSNWIGRKASLLYTSILPVSSWCLICCAVHPVMIHIARFLMGLYSGVVLTVVPLYIGEVAEPERRGKLGFLMQLFTNFGLVFAYAVGMVTSYFVFAIILGILPIVHTLLVVYIPESPYWLTYKGKNEKAVKNLSWLRGDAVVDKEADYISKAVDSDLRKPKTFKTLFTNRGYLKALIIVEVASSSQRLTGISTLMAYISIILPLAERDLTPDKCSLIIGVSYIIGVVLAQMLIDKMGRIPLMAISCSGCGITMLSATIWYFIHETTRRLVLSWMPLVIFTIYGILFNTGCGPIPTVLQGEMFPSHLKGMASAVTVIVLAATSAVANFIFLPIRDGVGMWLNFLMYSACSFGCLAFVLIYAIETKGKTLYEIQEILSK